MIINGILVDGRTCTGKVIIPDTVTKIASWAFCGCGTMQEVQIPEGVTELLESNFYDCSSLEKITIPISMTYIEGLFIFQTAQRHFSKPTWTATEKSTPLTFSMPWSMLPIVALD